MPPSACPALAPLGRLHSHPDLSVVPHRRTSRGRSFPSRCICGLASRQKAQKQYECNASKFHRTSFGTEQAVIRPASNMVKIDRLYIGLKRQFTAHYSIPEFLIFPGSGPVAALAQKGLYPAVSEEPKASLSAKQTCRDRNWRFELNALQRTSVVRPRRTIQSCGALCRQRVQIGSKQGADNDHAADNRRWAGVFANHQPHKLSLIHI